MCTRHLHFWTEHTCHPLANRYLSPKSTSGLHWIKDYNRTQRMSRLLIPRPKAVVAMSTAIWPPSNAACAAARSACVLSAVYAATYSKLAIEKKSRHHLRKMLHKCSCMCDQRPWRTPSTSCTAAKKPGWLSDAPKACLRTLPLSRTSASSTDRIVSTSALLTQ